LGVIGAAHGVRGAMKVKTFTQTPQDLAAYGPLTDEKGERVFVIESCKADKQGARVTLAGVKDRDAAQKLTGTSLYVARAKLPSLEAADDFYYADLIGLQVRDEAGAASGVVAAVHNFGAGDLLEITGDDGAGYYPFTKRVVPHIDIAAGFLTLVPPLEDEARPPEQISQNHKEADE
jgi:16S rRNA processing protein RimM